MHLFLHILLFLIFPVQDNYQKVASVEVAGDQFCSDPMGNVYVIKANSLKKYNQKSELLGEYTNTFLGNIFSIDVSDPLRILIYYKDYNQIVWVDNFLSEIRSPVSLDNLGIDQAELVCSSSQGGFWVFNRLDNQLQYYDINLALIHESLSLSAWMNTATTFSCLAEKNRHIYLGVPGTGILEFDRFGNYSRSLAVDIRGRFQLTDESIFHFSEGQLLKYDLATGESGILRLPQISNISGAERQPGYLFLYTKNGYSVYK